MKRAEKAGVLLLVVVWLVGEGYFVLGRTITANVTINAGPPGVAVALPTPTLTPSPSPSPSPPPAPTSAPAHAFPEMCDITHTYWLTSGGTGGLADQPHLSTPTPDGPLVEGRLAVIGGDIHHRDVDLMNLDGSARIHLVSDADDAGQPVWSPDNQMVAVTWTAEGQRTQLTWATALGARKRTLALDSGDIRSLSWSPDDRTLLLVEAHGETLSAEMIIARSGMRRPLLDGLRAIDAPSYGAGLGIYSIIPWKTSDGRVGYDGFDRHGRRLFHEVTAEDISSMSGLFVSPDRSKAAVKIRSFRGESLVLTHADGSPPVTLAAGLAGLGDPLWSPDSKLLAFTQSARLGIISWNVVDADGRGQWALLPDAQNGYFDMVSWDLGWARCPR